ncbi:MAG: Holliday junction resolvase RuvX [Phycisphaerae bacterium]|jgi:putative Holliday junction resolvase|nr:Holliday junction resolvase RuvX [Phycisphaerae bacterium]
MARWLGIDHGSKRIGVAVGDASVAIATPVTVLDGASFDEAAEQILRISDEHGASGIVVGWPLNMDDTEGPQGKTARQFALNLAERTALDVRLWDERLSSFQADQALAGAFTRKQKKARQDAIAAAVILQDFLSAGGPQGAPRPSEVTD